MLSPWERVRPQRWHADAAFESSLQDLEHMSDHMNQLGNPFSRDLWADTGFDSDDDFFADLPMHKVSGKKQKTESDQSASTDSDDDPEGKRGYSSYSYSSSSIMDDNGKPVKSTRRHYTDSRGRMKAIHDREYNGKKLRSTWHRRNKDDEGTYETICSDGTPEDFEKLWSGTVFGQNDTKRIQDKDSD